MLGVGLFERGAEKVRRGLTWGDSGASSELEVEMTEAFLLRSASDVVSSVRSTSSIQAKFALATPSHALPYLNRQLYASKAIYIKAQLLSSLELSAFPLPPSAASTSPTTSTPLRSAARMMNKVRRFHQNSGIPLHYMSCCRSTPSSAAVQGRALEGYY